MIAVEAVSHPRAPAEAPPLSEAAAAAWVPHLCFLTCLGRWTLRGRSPADDLLDAWQGRLPRAEP